MENLLHGSVAHFKLETTHGQIAFVYPGDYCTPGTARLVNHAKYSYLRRGWHIDGTASNFTPGVSDHFGEIQNFDVLIGVLLSDVTEEMSGEVALYPGSHTALSKWFASSENLRAVRDSGGARLPRNMTENFRQEVHGLGKRGDVFILNYMTAHFVTPNTNSDVRQAVYFRLSGTSFQPGDMSPLMDPWMNWKI